MCGKELDTKAYMAMINEPGITLDKVIDKIYKDYKDKYKESSTSSNQYTQDNIAKITDACHFVYPDGEVCELNTQKYLDMLASGRDANEILDLIKYAKGQMAAGRASSKASSEAAARAAEAGAKREQTSAAAAQKSANEASQKVSDRATIEEEAKKAGLDPKSYVTAYNNGKSLSEIVSEIETIKNKAKITDACRLVYPDGEVYQLNTQKYLDMLASGRDVNEILNEIKYAKGQMIAARSASLAASKAGAEAAAKGAKREQASAAAAQKSANEASQKAGDKLTIEEAANKAGLDPKSYIAAYNNGKSVSDIISTIKADKKEAERQADLAKIRQACGGSNTASSGALSKSQNPYKYLGCEGQGQPISVEAEIFEEMYDAGVPVNEILAKIEKAKAKVEELTHANVLLNYFDKYETASEGGKADNKAAWKDLEVYASKADTPEEFKKAFEYFKNNPDKFKELETLKETKAGKPTDNIFTREELNTYISKLSSPHSLVQVQS